jgi:uncharacterized membrane protein/protein-disulfide isomerase
MEPMHAEALATKPDGRSSATDPASLRPPALLVLAALSLAGLGIAVYLLWVSFAKSGLPAGCGHGSGCDEVLNSRWSQIFGLPVSGLAVAVYLGVLTSLAPLRFATSPPQIRRAWIALSVLATALAGAAVWFVGLQFLVLKAICLWCLAEHAIGLLIAAIVFARSPVFWKTKFAPLAVGCLLMGGVALAQSLAPYHPPALQRLPGGRNGDTGPGPDRLISVLNGKLTLAPHELPVLGPVDAPKLLVVLFDYCCPHCRATHGYLLDGLASHKDELAVLVLPTPLNTKCNPYWEETEPRFEHACELARLALAVWRADRGAFPAFDAWLFEPEKPRDPVDARRHAGQLVTAAALEQALRDPWIDRQIEQNVVAYHNSGAERVPVILSPGMRSIVGRPESEAQLFQLLEKELSLRPSQASKPK